MQNTEQVLRQGLDAHQGGDFALAAENYRIILSSNPDQPETNHAMGLLMLNTGQFAAAADYFQRALQVHNQDKTLLRAYVDALILCERFDEALATIGSIRAGGFARWRVGRAGGNYSRENRGAQPEFRELVRR